MFGRRSVNVFTRLRQRRRNITLGAHFGTTVDRRKSVPFTIVFAEFESPEKPTVKLHHGICQPFAVE